MNAARTIRPLKSLWLAFAAALAAMAAVPSAQSLLITGKRPSRIIESTGPEVSMVAIPRFDGMHAIWGSTGQDPDGHIWFGVTAEGGAASAHLFELDPATDRMTDRGNVVDELKRAGVAKPGEHQAKIHSKIVPGPDDYLYFSSMDEEGEVEDGSVLPKWGGHLWRMKRATFKWEHLFAAPEALIAVAGGGRFVYTLGYFGHVLYQFDTASSAVKQVRVGSLEGHISRNFIADSRGHVYVPRLRTETDRLGRARVKASLVEFGTDLAEVKETPIEFDHYAEENVTASHGITGLQPMADGSWYFSTHKGFLFHIVPPPDGDAAATLTPVGWLHPSGATYVASLFSPDGRDTLYALSHDIIGSGGSGAYQWLTFTPGSLTCRVAPFVPPGDSDSRAVSRYLLYGSATKDASNRHYVVGGMPINGSLQPVIFRVEPRKR